MAEEYVAVAPPELLRSFLEYAQRLRVEIRQLSLWKIVKRFSLIAILAFLFVHTVAGTELPPPPRGFTWEEIPELKAAFLRPNGWFFKREKNKDTTAYFHYQGKHRKQW